MDSIILPSKEMYSVVRDDLVCIDHVSLMLSNESVLALASIFRWYWSVSYPFE